LDGRVEDGPRLTGVTGLSVPWLERGVPGARAARVGTHDRSDRRCHRTATSSAVLVMQPEAVGVAAHRGRVR